MKISSKIDKISKEVNDLWQDLIEHGARHLVLTAYRLKDEENLKNHLTDYIVDVCLLTFLSAKEKEKKEDIIKDYESLRNSLDKRFYEILEKMG